MSSNLTSTLALILALLVGGLAAAMDGHEAVDSDKTEMLKLSSHNVRKIEANQNLLGFSKTRVFYKIAEQHKVVLITFSNADATSISCSGIVYEFASSANSDALDKWINNQYSDALYMEVPEPVKKHDIPKDSIKIVSTQLVKVHKADKSDYEQHEVSFAIEKVRLHANLTFIEFKDTTNIFVPQNH